jgi:hypothetical protein
MDARTMLGQWLAFAKTAAANPPQAQPGTDEWHREVNAILSAFTISALLGDLIARDPERADWLANQIHHALEEGDPVYDLVAEWQNGFAAGEPVQITERPARPEDVAPPEEETVGRHAQSVLRPSTQQPPRWPQAHDPAVVEPPQPAPRPVATTPEQQAVQALNWLAQFNRAAANHLHEQWGAVSIGPADVLTGVHNVYDAMQTNQQPRSFGPQQS